MNEKRKAIRLNEGNEVAVTVVSAADKVLKGRTFYNHSRDISTSGSRIKANIFLPVNTLLRIEMKLETFHQMVNVLGKVRWTKVVFGDESFEAGVEFLNTPGDVTKKLADYISMKQKFCKLYS